jgi:hypothetical protein
MVSRIVLNDPGSKDLCLDTYEVKYMASLPDRYVTHQDLSATHLTCDIKYSHSLVTGRIRLQIFFSSEREDQC